VILTLTTVVGWKPNGLTLIVDAVTHGSNILDQVYTNRPDMTLCHALVSRSPIMTKHMAAVVSSNEFWQVHACTAPERKRTLLYDLRMHNIDRLAAWHSW